MKTEDRSSTRAPSGRTLSRIFVVDDEPRVTRSTCMLLETYLRRCELTGFTDPYEAYNAVVAERPAVLITDMNMPRCTGVELARALHRSLGTERPRMMLYCGQPLERRTDALLFDRLLLKPAPAADLAHGAMALLEHGVSGTRRRARTFSVDELRADGETD